MTSIYSDVELSEQLTKNTTKVIKKNDCLLNPNMCNNNGKPRDVLKHLENNFMPYLDKQCQIPLVNWCEQEIKYKQNY